MKHLMFRKLTLALCIFTLLAFPVFAENDAEYDLAYEEEIDQITEAAAYEEEAEAVAEVAVYEEETEAVTEAAAYEEADQIAEIVAEEEVYEIPETIRNNRFYRESVRLTRLAHETFEFGDYDASSGFAMEAIRFAQLSDEFVASQLIVEARRMLGWAETHNMAERHRNIYNQSREYYDSSVVFHEEGEWDESISASTRSIRLIAALEAGLTPEVAAAREATLPAQYTVRTWARERDSLWTIAGYPWVYNNPWLWRYLFEANRHRMPDPNNPHLIEPGFVLDIPSIRGEVREGMWTP